MDTLTLTLCPDNDPNGLPLTLQSSRSLPPLMEMPTGSGVVYNNKSYTFTLTAPNVSLPSTIYINDDMYDTVLLRQTAVDSLTFKLKDCPRPFLTCFGAVRIELSQGGQNYHSESIAVMVSNNAINNHVLQMIEYIYENGEKYLYEEHRHSMIATGTKSSEIVSLEAKLHFLNNTVEVYRKAYPALKTNPYAKLKKTEGVDAFYKLTSVSANTVRYIATHTDELTPVDYDTGIRFNGQYYQPHRVLIEQNTYSNDVYENRIIVGFLKTVVEDIRRDIRQLQQYTARFQQPVAAAGYVNSMVQIFSRNRKRIDGYITRLQELQKQYQELYYFYSKLMGIAPEPVRSLPQFTAVFRSMAAYRQLFEVICQWFSIGDYDLGKTDFLLTFVASDKIYEYYCLVKMLSYLHQQMKLQKAERFVYPLRYPGEEEVRHANTFTFTNSQGNRLTLYFQPVIYGKRPAVNGVRLYRNTSTKIRSDDSTVGGFYTPDYLIRFDAGDQTRYLILDAKFSTPDNILLYQMQDLVYKYLFSVSPLDANGQIAGLYILCGRPGKNHSLFDPDHPVLVHDIAAQQGRTVNPFAEFLVVGGVNTQDCRMMQTIFDSLLP